MRLPLLNALRARRSPRARANVRKMARARSASKYGAGGAWSTRVSPAIKRGARYTVQDVIVPTAKRTGRGIKYTVQRVIVPTTKAVGRGARYTAKKGYQGIAYVSPKIYRGAGRVYSAVSPHIIGATRATGRALGKYVLSPTYEWLAGHARNARRGISRRALAFHEYMMSP